jgi:DNA polymerase III epsilon subunit-like protein
MPGFVGFLGKSDSLLVAHNAAFDIGFLAMAMGFDRNEVPQHCVLDSLQLAYDLVPSLPNGRLETVASQLGVQAPRFHRAMADALTVKQIIVRLLGPFRTIGDLLMVAQPLCFSDADLSPCELPDGFEMLAAAIEERRQIIVVYAGGVRSESLRTVTPLAVVEFGGRQYLNAICHLAKQTRTFRLDRIRTLRLADG